MCKSIIGVAFSVPLLGFTAAQLIAVGVSIAGFVSFLVYLFRRLFAFLVLEFNSIDSVLGSDLYSFVSYTLNFDFLGGFFTLYYVVFCGFVISYITIRVFTFCSHVYPYFVGRIRSCINWMSGDS